MTLNYIDLLIVFIILLSIANGWRRGFISGLFDLIRWVGGLTLAFTFYFPVAGFLEVHTEIDKIWTQPLAFILLFIGFGILIHFLGRQIAKQMPSDFLINKFDQILGILPGFASGLVLASVISALLFSLPVSREFQESLEKSYLAENLAVQTDKIETALTPIFEDALNETLTRRLTNYPGSDEMVELPFKVDDYKPRPDLEAEMLEMVNRERAIEGLSPVKADTEMLEVARKHSADMFKRGYFSHYTPEKKDPFDRMREDGVKFRTAGENLAIAPTLKVAHTGLMNSPGHRANILRPQFGRVGIGILDGGRRGLMITQNFRN